MSAYVRFARTAFVRLVIASLLVSLVLEAPPRPVSGAAQRRVPAAARNPHGYCYPDGVQASGAIFRICMPTVPIPWNHDVIIYAHGYVTPTEPVGIPESQLYLPDGTYLPDVANLLGYGFAVTSYYTNGLAVPGGLADLVDLVAIFRNAFPGTENVYLAGVSEGGLITVLGAEEHPESFSGAVATCGPVGDFYGQINYVGDFRVAFDYFFPGLMPGSPISIPQSLMNDWDNHFATVILPALEDPANAISVTQLISVTRAAVDPLQPTSTISTVAGVLWYNVFGTNDAIAKLGGQPFDNHDRWYTGSLNDARLNALIERFTADPAALAEIHAHYQTRGRPLVPLVTLHTTLDPIVPYWHETLYRTRVVQNGYGPRHDNLTVQRYGHCAFTTAEVLQALSLLVDRVANPPPFQAYTPVAQYNASGR